MLSLGIRVIYEERKDDPDILGFIEIGLNADNAFNGTCSGLCKERL